MASAELRQIVSVLRAMPRRENPSVGGLRRSFDAMVRMFPPPPDVRVEPGTVGGVPGERVTPPDAVGGRTVLYLHGGGFVFGSPATHRELVARICRASGAAAWVPEYRLAPENPFPAGIEDCVAAYRGLLEEGTPPHHIVIAGDSAGGGLTMATLLSLRDAGVPLPAAAVCLSPWVDLAITGSSVDARAELDPWIPKEGLRLMANHYLAGGNPRHPLASPILANLSGLPPLLVQVGTSEVLYDDSDRLAARAQASGVDVTFEPWDEMIHVWQFFPMLPEAQEAVNRIGRFIREKMG
jgi:acetyl esterase/lipase